MPPHRSNEERDPSHALRHRPARADRAEMGIGTMIIFIAMVLVAAVAAAVLIGTSGDLQERSTRAGREATAQVSNNLFIRETTGEVNRCGACANAGLLDNITILVSLAPGASQMDLSRMVVRWVAQEAAFEFNLTMNETYATAPNTTAFFAEEALSVDDDASVIRGGDLVKITIYNRGVNPREEVSITFLPEIGAPARAGFKAPPSFGLDRFLVLT